MLKTCRTCLVGIRDTTYVMLNKTDVKGKTVRTELLACLPELQLDLVKDPVICRNCVNILQLAHSFKIRCLLTEKRIQSCIRNAKLNGKPVTLTKLFRFSRETNGGNDCSTINGSVVKDSDVVNSNPTAGQRFPVQSGRASLDIEADNDDHERIDDCVTSTENEDSNVVVSSEGSLVEGEDDSDLENIITTNIITARIGLTLQPLEFQNKILGWSSAAMCTDILGEMSQDLVNTMDDDIVKEECDLSTFKTETDEALSFKEESSNNNEEERCDDCKTGTWEDVIEETRSITDHAEGNNLIDNGGYKFPAVTTDGEKFVGSNSKNLNNQIKKSSVSVCRLSKNSNNSCELYSDSTTSSYENITKENVPSVKKRRVNFEEETTNNYSTSSLIQNSQEMSDTDEDGVTKKEQELEIFKAKESLNKITFKNCTINTDVPIKECFVNLERLHLGELMNKSSFNADELFNVTSLPKRSKKMESARRNGNSNSSKQRQTHSKKKSFRCKVCKYSTIWKSILIVHMRIHTGEKPFQCEVCEYSSTQKNHLINHMRTHTGEKPFRCNLCDYSTAYKTALTRHLQVHTDEKPFKCNVCEYSANQKENLSRHMRIHIGEKRFRCNVCELSMTRKEHLIAHMRKHTGEKPFKCNICDYRAILKRYLISHMQTHTGEKPFQCNLCEYSAVEKQNLIRHMRIHTGEKSFKCNVCEYRTVRKQCLIRHMRTHTSEKP